MEGLCRGIILTRKNQIDKIRNYNGLCASRRVEMSDPKAIPAECNRIATINYLGRLDERTDGRFKDCLSIGDDPIDDELERESSHSRVSLL
jgi:hypothetical protein